jgi:hypothetical protein
MTTFPARRGDDTVLRPLGEGGMARAAGDVEDDDDIAERCGASGLLRGSNRRRMGLYTTSWAAVMNIHQRVAQQ